MELLQQEYEQVSYLITMVKAELARVQQVLANHRHHQDEIRESLEGLELAKKATEDKSGLLSALLRVHQAELLAPPLSEAWKSWLEKKPRSL